MATQQANSVKCFGLIGLIFLAALISACASNIDVSQVKLGNPQAELALVKDKVEEAKQLNVPLLSPGYMGNAEKNIKIAEDLTVKRRTNTEEFVTAVALAKEYLNKAMKSAKIAATEIKPAIEARQAAIKAQVHQLYASKFESAEQQFKELTAYVEEGSMKSARSESLKVKKYYNQLEIRAIKEHKLGDAKKLIQTAERNGARKYVPATLKVAKAKFTETENYIHKNPHGKEVQSRADELMRSAKHVNAALATVKAWTRLSSEEIYISVERKVLGLQIMASGSGSPRVESLDKRFHTLSENIKSRIESQKFLNEEVTRVQQELQAANKEMQALNEVKRKRQLELQFQSKFQRVRELFEPAEAEIYRQGSTLLVRLKGMNFEVGKSYILPQHYPMLNKVQKAIKIFGTERTVIEGHTDSSGSAAQNKVLSQQRADAVMAYLVNNGAIARRNVTAIGYGPDKPITANTSKSGRKMNRRIDIVLLVNQI